MYSIIVAILFAIQIVSVLTFLTGASAKLKRAHVKRYTLRSCAKHLGGLAVTSLPGASGSFNPALLIGRWWFLTCALALHYKRLKIPPEDVACGVGLDSQCKVILGCWQKVYYSIWTVFPNAPW